MFPSFRSDGCLERLIIDEPRLEKNSIVCRSSRLTGFTNEVRRYKGSREGRYELMIEEYKSSGSTKRLNHGEENTKGARLHHMTAHSLVWGFGSP